jgi:hypothetical protein
VGLITVKMSFRWVKRQNRGNLSFKEYAEIMSRLLKGYIFTGLEPFLRFRSLSLFLRVRLFSKYNLPSPLLIDNHRLINTEIIVHGFHNTRRYVDTPSRSICKICIARPVSSPACVVKSLATVCKWRPIIYIC